MRIISIAQAQGYPKYVAELREGRFKGQYPASIAHIPSMKRQWDRGGLGSGVKLQEITETSPAKLISELRRRGISLQHDEVEVYEIRSPGSPRVRIPTNRLLLMAERPQTA